MHDAIGGSSWVNGQSFILHVTLFLDVMGYILPYPTPGNIYFCEKQKGYIYKLINVVLVGSGIEGKSYNFHNLKCIIILDWKWAR